MPQREAASDYAERMTTRGFADYEHLGFTRHGSHTLAVEIRPAVLGDVPRILELQERAGRAVPEFGAMVRALADEQRLTVAAWTDGVMTGWGKTHYWAGADAPAPAGHYLGGVTVDPSFRRRGIGTALTQARLDWIWQRAGDAWYVVNVDNRASIDLHSRWGFVEVARAARFHTTEFAGGVGLLMRGTRPERSGL
jgi:aminoglycoside 6'-N-acetyltransferase I